MGQEDSVVSVVLCWGSHRGGKRTLLLGMGVGRLLACWIVWAYITLRTESCTGPWIRIQALAFSLASLVLAAWGGMHCVVMLSRSHTALRHLIRQRRFAAIVHAPSESTYKAASFG